MPPRRDSFRRNRVAPSLLFYHWYPHRFLVDLCWRRFLALLRLCGSFFLLFVFLLFFLALFLCFRSRADLFQFIHDDVGDLSARRKPIPCRHVARAQNESASRMYKAILVIKPARLMINLQDRICRAAANKKQSPLLELLLLLQFSFAHFRFCQPSPRLHLNCLKRFHDFDRVGFLRSSFLLYERRDLLSPFLNVPAVRTSGQKSHCSKYQREISHLR